jgi:hypothetical protein
MAAHNDAGAKNVDDKWSAARTFSMRGGVLNEAHEAKSALQHWSSWSSHRNAIAF